jgi:hypothetical protein
VNYPSGPKKTDSGNSGTDIFSSLLGNTRAIVVMGGVCDQKTSKFFVSYQGESMAGHVGIKGVY